MYGEDMNISEQRRLLACVDLLESTLSELHSPNGAIIYPRTLDVMQRREIKQVRADYKPVMNSHITIHIRSVVAELREIAGTVGAWGDVVPVTDVRVGDVVHDFNFTGHTARVIGVGKRLTAIVLEVRFTEGESDTDEWWYDPDVEIEIIERAEDTTS